MSICESLVESLVESDTVGEAREECMMQVDSNKRCTHFVCCTAGAVVSSTSLTSDDAVWLSPWLKQYCIVEDCLVEEADEESADEDDELAQEFFCRDKFKPRDSGDSILSVIPGEPLGWSVDLEGGISHTIERDLESGEPIPVASTPR
jgi:hypothetical protein